MSRPELLEGSPLPNMLETSMQQQQEAVSQSNIYRIAWQRKSLLILGLLLAIVIGILYYTQKEPVYQSQALMAVQRKNAIYNDSRQALAAQEDYLTYHATLLRTPRILSKVAADSEIKKLETFSGKNPADVITSLITGLSVVRDTRDPSSRSPVLQLTYKGPYASDCPTIVDAIYRHFREYLKENSSNQSSDLLRQIRTAENGLRVDYQRLIKQHTDFLEQNAGIPMSSGTTKDPIFARLDMLLQVRIDTMKQKLDIESRLDNVKKGIERGWTRAVLQSLPNSAAVKPGAEGSAALSMNSTNEKILQLEQAEKVLSSRLGPNHPDLKDIRLQLESLQSFLNQQTEELSKLNSTNREDRTSRETPIEAIVNFFRLELERYDSILKTLDNEIAKEKDLLKDSSLLAMKNEDFKNQKDAMLKVLTALTEQMSGTKVNREEATFEADLLTPPTLAQKVEPRLFVILVLSTIFGLLGGFALAYLADMTDKSFRSPEEIRRRLNIPVVGHIPILISEEEAAKLEGAINGPDPTLVTYYRPKSRKSEVFRGIRTALYFSTRGEGHKVIQITSPNMGDGKTTLSSNL
ncbi:MAG TPA: Wzz/FepE/Etk N-terminal domain-containing protein, partial [Gemmatales bacterium]|nr:Wzz/FepE/Etk N-terminal domain-containing protein [Gemmatales bacterium]